ncbi:glycine cleavage system H protein [Hypericibacter terrae]|jgi:glycine cleavage system H protein|uniref:Glycine cleavage system H protein n=1 Tax=Hypericibacter terrae TaxID=2602015 RepID=A0A5J6ML98_9PROT|nr:glycine cleavage system protein GcvH [Hypericibacter terrae]QEX15516.1 glycine cleavage system H protein [Hypericibacter terrae]
MSTLRYTEEHEWIRVEGDTATIGISAYAQEQLGDVVFVDLPQPGKKVEKGKEVAVVESVKAASEVYAPVSGEVVAVNSDLATEPARVNSDPMGNGWFVKLKLSNKAELDGLMDQAAYDAYVKGLH